MTSSFHYAPFAAIIFLCAPAQAQECVSRPTIQQRLLPMIDPLREALIAIAVGRGDVEYTNTKLAEAFGLVNQWTDAPQRVDGCRKRVK